MYKYNPCEWKQGVYECTNEALRLFEPRSSTPWEREGEGWDVWGGTAVPGDPQEHGQVEEHSGTEQQDAGGLGAAVASTTPG